MPKPSRINSNGDRAISWALFKERPPSTTNNTPTVLVETDHKWIDVLTASDWTSDASLYEDAPTWGTIVYADVLHNMGTETASFHKYILPSTGRRYANVVDEMPTPGNEENSLRIWLSANPGEDIKVCILK